MNTLLDTVSLRLDLGYRFSNSSHRVNILQHADDTCPMANPPASCQHLLHTTAAWLQWSGMVAKIPKFQCLSMKGSLGKLSDPHITLSSVPIPFSTHPVRFLGMDGCTGPQEPLCGKGEHPVETQQDACGHRPNPSLKEAEASPLLWWSVSTAVLATDDPEVPCYLDGAEG